MYYVTNKKSFNELKFQIICEFNKKKVLYENKKWYIWIKYISKEECDEYPKSINSLFFEISIIDYESV